MEIYVINPFQDTSPHFPIVGIIPSYYSMIWNPQLYGLGYFEVTIPATDEYFKMLRGGRFLVRAEDINADNGMKYNNAMVIRRISIKYDADQGLLMTVSGKSVKDILSQRIIWDLYTADDANLTDIIVDLLNAEIVDPVTYTENTILDLADQVSDLYDDKTQKDNELIAAKAAYQQAVSQFGPDSDQAKAAKEYVDQVEAEILAIVEKIATKQSIIDYYDDEMDNVQPKRQIPYIYSTAVDPPQNPPVVTVQLRGENFGDWVESICMENHLGWDIELTDNGMYFKYKSGTDRSSTVIFSPEFDNLLSCDYVRSIETFRNTGLVGGDGEGEEQIVVDIGTTTSFNRYEEYIDATSVTQNDGEIPLAKYKKMLKQYGNSAIARLRNKESIDGEIDTNGAFKIGEDFDLGDIVTVENGQGVSATVKLVELIYSDDESGPKVTGIFDEWEV